MIRLVITAAAAICLILLVAIFVSRLVRTRTAGMSVRMQIFIALGAVIGAFALGLGVLVIDRIEARARFLAEGSARDEAAVFAAVVAMEIETRGVRLEDVRSVDAGGLDVVLNLALLDPEGRTVRSSGPSPGEPGNVFVTAPVLVRGERVGAVRVVKPTIVVERMVADFAPPILVLSTVLVAAAAVSSLIIGRAIAAPIESLTDFAVRVSEGERRAPPPPAHGREVQRLARAIDTMRRDLEGRPFVETFAADLSHELKNPVAAIRASAEVLEGGALDDREEATRFVGRIQEATARIEAMLGDLLSLARMEARGVEQMEVVDLMSVAEAAADRARERGSAVVVTGAGAIVRGDALWLGRALDNLLDNARMHGDPEAPVRVALTRADSKVLLSVKSRGQIARHIAGRMFRRFVTTRADKGGTGLGLAIVRAIAEAHSGSAECIERGPPDVEVQLSLPAA
ncbi:histidine kinase dimerization/phospho-acceptor domain-containing protein [Chondromyces crocatus]|uniref:histidine kinase n=1 Tax=Chondromyces crocatus TaxID=52 RepID=A0A0K1ELW3_CHOCO|nr:histidine kinase dimerization/phospho-acceptor domain-containing protein [Chondromyces crocatus]AKT41890.1 two-component system sensor protein [Chondromyces crocatus]